MICPWIWLWIEEIYVSITFALSLLFNETDLNISINHKFNASSILQTTYPTLSKVSCCTLYEQHRNLIVSFALQYERTKLKYKSLILTAWNMLSNSSYLRHLIAQLDSILEILYSILNIVLNKFGSLDWMTFLFAINFRYISILILIIKVYMIQRISSTNHILNRRCSEHIENFVNRILSYSTNHRLTD